MVCKKKYRKTVFIIISRVCLLFYMNLCMSKDLKKYLKKKCNFNGDIDMDVLPAIVNENENAEKRKT